jgi:hypothetical protein
LEGFEEKRKLMIQRYLIFQEAEGGRRNQPYRDFEWASSKVKELGQRANRSCGRDIQTW